MVVEKKKGIYDVSMEMNCRNSMFRIFKDLGGVLSSIVILGLFVRFLFVIQNTLSFRNIFPFDETYVLFDRDSSYPQVHFQIFF